MYKYYFELYLSKTKNKNKTVITTIKNIFILKYLFCFFVLSTKLTYSSSKFVLMFIFMTKFLNGLFFIYKFIKPRAKLNILNQTHLKISINVNIWN